MDYASLKPGQVVSSSSYVLDADAIARYQAAVDNRLPWRASDAAPPMALAALGLGGVVNDLAIPGGTLHAGQELQFHAEARPGDRVSCQATLAQTSVRGGWRFLVVELLVSRDGTPLVTGKSTIMLPVGASGGRPS